jgi:hypothetical protein
VFCHESAGLAAGPSLLEYGTKLVGGSQGYWGVGLFPDAAEGVAFFHSAYAKRRGGSGGDPEESRKVAARRARTRVRRFCAANRLNRFATLTYAPPFCRDPRVLREHVGKFFRTLRGQLGGDAFPYLWTGELHADGLRWHAHFAVGRYVPRMKIVAAWPHGFVHIKLLGDLPYAASSLDQARRAAGYLSKYVGKSFGDQGQGLGLHRYEVAQGFAPRGESFRGPSSEVVIAWAVERMGREPDFVQRSTEWRDYQGPPALFVSWT